MTNHPTTKEFWRIRLNYYQCKTLIKNQARKWKDDNLERRRELQKAHYQRHREKIIQDNYEYCKKRRKVDINYNLTILLRQRLNKAVKNHFKSGSAVADLGCTIEFLKLHLESLFQPGMSWDNQGQWHIDHIKPISSFNLSDYTELKQACHYSNLQPLWAVDNLTKSNKIITHK